MCFGNLWGTICHNSWDNRDAGVICEQLFNNKFGELIFLNTYTIIFSCEMMYYLSLVGGYAINGSRFGSGDMPIVIDSMNCNGTEDSITDCPITSSAINTCNSSTIAAVTCYGM